MDADELLKTAKPRSVNRVREYWGWLDGTGAPEDGVLPQDFLVRMATEDRTDTRAMEWNVGGKWFLSEEAAMAALAEAVRKYKDANPG